MKHLLLLFIFCPIVLFSQDLTNATNLDITKSWEQEPQGWTYSVSVHVPEVSSPVDGFPICILLHGNGGNGSAFLSDFKDNIPCHILVAPDGYENSWNICGEDSDAPDMEMIEELITAVESYDNVNSSMIRIIGFSNGAALTNRIFVENNHQGIDKFCAIVSQFTDMQLHNQSFYGPSSVTEAGLPFCGYDTEFIPETGRHYLNICNTNDPIIPYDGGPAVGAIFVPAKVSIYEVAKSQGYTGSIISGDGEEINSSGVFEYNYLSGQVVHLRGDAQHGLNPTQTQFVSDFMEFDCSSSGLITEEYENIKIETNPGLSGVRLIVKNENTTEYTTILTELNGKTIYEGIISETTFIPAIPGQYILKVLGENIRLQETIIIL